MSKLVASIKEAIEKCELRDGMTISFHHHMRNGDYVLNMVLDEIAKMGIKNLTVNASSIFDVHEPIIGHIKNGVVTGIECNYMGAKVGKAISEGIMDKPVVFRSHGGRASDMEKGTSVIDVAFIAAPTADDMGNCTGKIGPSACGSIGYAFADAMNAKKVVVVTDNLVAYPLVGFSIPEVYVDYVVKVDQIGNPAGIVSGTTKITRDPVGLKMASYAAKVIEASGLLKDGFSFQTGAGAIAIATTKYLADRMREHGVKASFALGGIPAAIIDMYDEGLVRAVECSQSFDAVAASAISTRPGVVEIDNADYANAYSKGGFLNREDFGVLGALEVDTDFNVNILTGSSGEMMGGLGGGPDVAGGAAISIVTIPIIRGRTPSIVKKVFTLCTPGETVAAVVTEAGIALNPKHKSYKELKEDLEKTSLKLVTIEELQQLAESLTGVPKPIETSDRVACIVEYRDGTVIDVIREVKR